MKKIIYGLLVTASVVGSAVDATQAPPRPTTSPKVAPQRPTTHAPTGSAKGPLKTDSSICPDDLNMTQLKNLKANGSLELGGHNFTLHTSKTEFDAMLPGEAQLISKGKSIAHIAEKGGRAIIPEVAGRVLKCAYEFRTAVKSILPKKFTGVETFTIMSEPTEFEKEPAGLVEAIVGSGG